MDFMEYQEKAASTVAYKDRGELGGIVYTTLGLAGEAGEIANKVKKVIRGDAPLGPIKRLELAQELGDVLWYVSELAQNIGFSLDSIAEMNIRKLASRNERGVVQGSGDNR